MCFVSVCVRVCGRGEHAAEEREGRGCEVVPTPYEYVSANLCTPLCVLRARGRGLGFLCARLGGREGDSLFLVA